MTSRTNYFKLGLFIIGATALLLVALVFFGLGTLTKHKIMLETYFDESVQGIDVGSPLKFKGVKIGSVERIRFANDKYPTKGTPYRYVLVEMALDPNTPLPIHRGELREALEKGGIQEALEREVRKGLRIRITPQGLTGTAYLEMDYVTPKAATLLPISWTPEYLYVPSTPSTIARLEETFETFSKILSRLEEAGLDKAIQNLDALLVLSRQAVADANLGKLSDNLNGLVSDLRKTNDNLKIFTGSKDTRAALQNLAASLGNLKVSTDTLPQAITDLRRFLREANSLVSTQHDDVQNILQQGRQMLENLNDLTGDAKHNPSRLFFGAPPAKVNPEKNR